MRLGCQETRRARPVQRAGCGRVQSGNPSWSQRARVSLHDHPSMHPELGFIVSRAISPPRSSISSRPFSPRACLPQHTHSHTTDCRPDNSPPTDSYPHPYSPKRQDFMLVAFYSAIAIKGQCSPFRNSCIAGTVNRRVQLSMRMTLIQFPRTAIATIDRTFACLLNIPGHHKQASDIIPYIP